MTAQAAGRKPTSAGIIIAVLGMLSAFAPLASDMYLPAFGAMAQDLHVPETDIASTLSVFFLGLTIGQAIYGPIIDRYGRRIPLLAGIALYVLTTLACLLSTDIHVLVALRFMQAVGGCAGIIIGRAIVNDMFNQQESARALSLLIVVMTVAPIVAPTVGGFIITHASWRMIFALLLVFGLSCGVLVWLLIPETHPMDARRPISVASIAHTWGTLIRRRAFIVPAIVGGLAQACMFAFITGSPFVFITLHGASEQEYGWLFAIVALGLIISAQLNRILLRWRSPTYLLQAALIFGGIAGLTTVAVVPSNSLTLLVISLWLIIGMRGFISANAAAIAMAASGRDAGTGSSLIGVFQFGCAFLVSSLVAASHNGTAYPMTIGIATCSVLALLIWVVAGKRSDERSARR